MDIERIRVARRELEYRRLGTGGSGKPAIVFLHEGLGSVGLWRDFPDRVCARLNCEGLVYSRYGNGFSDVLTEARAASYMHDEALVVLPALLEALGIARPVLFGHSDGASIALIFAGAFPQEATALVLEAPHVFVEPVSVASIAAMGHEFRSGMLAQRMSRYHNDAERTFLGWNDIWLAPEFLAWDITASLTSIVVPTLCIQGTGDEYGTLAQIDAIAKRSGGVVDRVILDDCGHAPHRDRAGYVEAAACAWLETSINTTDDLGNARPTAHRSGRP